MHEVKNSLMLVVTVAFLITGNMVGAGILGLPVNTGIDGFIPSLIMMFVFGGAMLFTAIVLGKEAVIEKRDSFNLPSLYQKYLGNGGKWIAVMANMLILYGLLIAYLSGGTTIISEILKIEEFYYLVLFAFFFLLTFLTTMGMNLIQKYNALLMLLLWTAFGIIVFIGERHVEVARLHHTDWLFLPMAIPIILTSFHFHNIIPNVCKSLNWNMTTIWKAMLTGIILGYLMNAIWIQVGVGCIPLIGENDSLTYAFAHNLPATVPMANLLKSKMFMLFSMLFALLAISTSYITNGMGLIGFNTDLCENFLHKSNKWLVYGMTYLPPLIIALLFPNIFLKAINIVGGVGIVVLFGILPSLIFFLKTKGVLRKAFAIFMMLLFFAVLLFQIAQDLGLVHLRPKVNVTLSSVDSETKTADGKPAPGSQVK